jgi:ankyrin repeat protein
LSSCLRSTYSVVPFGQDELSFSSLAPHFDVHYFLERAIYLLSNQLLSYYGRHRQQIDRILESLLHRVPKGVLLELLERNTPSIRAAWERLVRLSYMSYRKDLFTLLLTVGIQHHQWADGRIHEFLDMAATLNCVDVARDLINIGARCMTVHIFTAIHAKSRDCLTFLIKDFDLDDLIRDDDDGWEVSNFGIFLLEALKLGKWKHLDPADYDLKNELFRNTLNTFLDRGGNVDLKLPATIFNRRDRQLFIDIPNTWVPSLLDMALYRNLDLFHYLIPYSQEFWSKITRPGIYLAAKQGTEPLQRLLESCTEQFGNKSKFLELVLVEQFLLPGSDIDIDFDTVLGLVQLGVDITLPSLKQDMSLLLHLLVTKARNKVLTEKAMVVVKLLLQNGAAIEPSILAAAVADQGLGRLQMLNHFGCDLRSNGPLALAKAISLNNFEAVTWLLQNGVDKDATIPHKDLSVISMAIRWNWNLPFEEISNTRHQHTSFEMLRYLVTYEPDIKPSQSREFALFEDLLRYSRLRAQEIIQLCLDSGADRFPELEAGEPLLEMCFSPNGYRQRPICEALELFTFLVEQGASVQSDSPLSHVVCQTGSLESIQWLLDTGANINAYPKIDVAPTARRYTPLQAAAGLCNMEILSSLLHKGADINQPAFRCRGRTVLQAICEWNPLSSEEEDDKDQLLRFLFDHGANANAPPAMHHGMTALEISAQQGDLRTAVLLVGHGADVNVIGGKRFIWADFPQRLRPLDGAVHCGRLDVTKFLLNTGAISGDPGQTGYDGAIRIAERQNFYGISDAIRNHLASHIQTWGTNPQVLLAPKAVETVDMGDQICDVCHGPM